MLLAVLDIAALMALAGTHPIATVIIALVLCGGVVMNTNIAPCLKDKINGLIGRTKVPATDSEDGVKLKASAIGDKVKSKFEEVLGTLTGVGDAVDSSALQLGTLALREHYLKHVNASDLDAVNVAFQSLLNINAKLPEPEAV